MVMAFSLVFFISILCFPFKLTLGSASESDTCSTPDSCERSVHTPLIQLSGCNTDCGRVELYDVNRQQWNAICYEPIENKTQLSQIICETVGFPKLHSVWSLSTEAAHLTATDQCIHVTNNNNCLQSQRSISDCLQNNILYPKQIANGTLLALSCQAANTVRLPQQYFTADSIPFATHFLNIFDSETQKLMETTDATETNVASESDDMQWLTVNSNDIKDSYIYSTDFMEEHGVSGDNTLSGIDTDTYNYNMVGINLNALYDTLDINSTEFSDDLQSVSSSIFNKFDNKIRQFQFSNSWGTSAFNFKLHALYHWVLDSPFRKQSYYKWAIKNVLPEGDTVAKSIYDELHFDGIAMIDDWGLSSAFLDELVAIFDDTLSQNDPTQFSSTSNGAVITVRRANALIEEYLTQGNMSLVNAIKAYLGPEVLLSGYKITKLTNNLGGKQDYHAGIYHHDRVGRRLKLFIFLNDIDCDVGRPTLVAQGTSLLEYWRASTYSSSRFMNSFVENKYNVMKGCGKRGGGFIFDTHSIHRAGVELQSEYGNNERLTVIAEYHNVIKCYLNEKYQLRMPCPSGDQYIVNRIL